MNRELLNKFDEMTAGLRTLVCLQNDILTTDTSDCMYRCFKELSRTTSALLYKRVEQHKYDIVFIDKAIVIDAQLIASIENIKRNFPMISIFMESDETDIERIVKIINLNIDKTLLSSMSQDEFCLQVERSLNSRYELALNAQYEKHLEDLLYGKTQELVVQQTCDILTGFENASALKNRFQDNVEKGILYLDIDKFDTINTLYGMKVGDEVLKQASQRLSQYLPNNTELFRISADEFAVLIAHPIKDQLIHLSEQIIALFSETAIMVNDISFEIFFSIGMDQGTAYDIFHNAKLANREAKYLGGKTAVIYKDGSKFLNMQKENHFWINEIKLALKDDRIIVYYQPIYDTVNKKVDKYEALVRLETITGDIITPNFFLKAAIISELITSVSRVVIDKAFKQFSTNDYSFSFNLSDQDFKEGYLEEFLQYKCKHYNVNPQRVYIEILEETSLNCSDDFLDQIHKLRSLGFKFSIDDFGIEKSNFSRVLDLEAEIVKIDGSFISNLDTNSNSSIIVHSIVDFAKKIGAKTVAEFVETAEVLAVLEEIGVDYAQGYLIGKPEPTLQCADGFLGD